MNSKPYFFVIGCALGLSACSTPKEVVTAADLVVNHSAQLKKQSSDFVRHANAVRSRAEVRLNRAQEEIAESKAAFSETGVVFRILDDKAAKRVLSELRADDPKIKADPLGYLSPTYDHAAEAVRFGTISAKSNALDTVIKNIDAIRKNRSVKETLAFAFKVGAKINKVLQDKKAAAEEGDAAEQ